MSWVGVLFPDSDRPVRTTVIAITPWWCHVCEVGQDTPQQEPPCWNCGEPMTRPGIYWNPASVSQWRCWRARQQT